MTILTELTTRRPGATAMPDPFTLSGPAALLVAGAGVAGVWSALPDFAGIAGGIVSVGLAAIGVYGYFQNKRIESWKAMERARIEIEKERDRELGPLIEHRFQALSEQHAALIRQMDLNTRITRQNNTGIAEIKQVVTGSGDAIDPAPKA